MMSGHGPNPIFLIIKIKTGRLEHSLTPHSPTSDNISFWPHLPIAMCITPMCITPNGIVFSIF